MWKLTFFSHICSHNMIYLWTLIKLGMSQYQVFILAGSTAWMNTNTGLLHFFMIMRTCCWEVFAFTRSWTKSSLPNSTQQIIIYYIFFFTPLFNMLQICQSLLRLTWMKFSQIIWQLSHEWLKLVIIINVSNRFVHCLARHF